MHAQKGEGTDKFLPGCQRKEAFSHDAQSVGTCSPPVQTGNLTNSKALGTVLPCVEAAEAGTSEICKVQEVILHNMDDVYFVLLKQKLAVLLDLGKVYQNTSALFHILMK